MDCENPSVRRALFLCIPSGRTLGTDCLCLNETEDWRWSFSLFHSCRPVRAVIS